ncbi:MAG: hypothetical protein JWN83_116 [Chitinophagaceae bacterium]|nr:hypothetical protein [Chitinophagaceae bacterium]
MKILLITFFASTVFALTGCNHKSDCKPYFQFDTVEHYFLNIDESDLWSIYDKKNKTKKERALLELLIVNTPLNLSNPNLLENFNQLGFVKKQIQASKFEQLNQIFCERKHKDVLVTSCIAIYRDILIFKRNNQIIGSAKICFDCDESIITGTKQNTEEFGQSGDYGKLYKLLH